MCNQLMRRQLRLQRFLNMHMHTNRCQKWQLSVTKSKDQEYSKGESKVQLKCKQVGNKHRLFMSMNLLLINSLQKMEFANLRTVLIFFRGDTIACFLPLVLFLNFRQSEKLCCHEEVPFFSKWRDPQHVLVL